MVYGEEPIGQILLDLGRLGAQHPGFSHKQQDMLRLVLRQAGVFTYQDKLDQKEPEFIETEMDRLKWSLEMDGQLHFETAIAFYFLSREGLSVLNQMESLKSLMNRGHKKGVTQVELTYVDATFQPALGFLSRYEDAVYSNLEFKVANLLMLGVISGEAGDRIGEIDSLEDFRFDPNYDDLMLEQHLGRGHTTPSAEAFIDLFDVVYLGAAMGVRDGIRAIRIEEELRGNE